ncbi:MAG TPA: hypothetical protein VFE91_03500 [Nitrososphaerales archaeon]|nr:hypothetical protein [Nitrososphaerales archaeon]
MDRRTRTMYRAVAWLSFFAIVVLVLYGLNESINVSKQPVGQVWVDVYWPFPPYFAQPVTYFSVASVALFYSGLRLWEERVSKWPQWVLMFLQLFGFVVAFSSAYEVMYNFMLWGSSYSVACADAIANLQPCNPDVINSLYPTPWNLVFATRAFSALFVISGYSVYYLRKFSASLLI